MILCWGEGHGSAIHDHSDSHCFMKILKGELAEVRYVHKYKWFVFSLFRFISIILGMPGQMIVQMKIYRIMLILVHQ